ncbi:transposase [Candidatus Parcubacteria bacterium]|nr:transposase [Candidatus Parcubacteria bacterium]
MQKPTFTDNSVYHIFNRGVEKRDIFLDPSYYSRWIDTIYHCLNYNYPYSILKRRLEKARTPQDKQIVLSQLEMKRIHPPVEVISLCLMPNHYHLTLKQLVGSGLTTFMHRIGTAYTNYFNLRQGRVGRLFETRFKAVWVESDQQLLHLTRYQHINPSKLGRNTLEDLVNYPWSSLSDYLGKPRFSFINPELVLSAFSNPEKTYSDFILAEIDEFEPLRMYKTTIDDDFGWFAELHALEKEQREQLRQRYLEIP